MTQRLLFDELETAALGRLQLVMDGESLCGLDFAEFEGRLRERLQRHYGAIAWVKATNPQGLTERLQTYLQGELHALDAIAVKPPGTPFQQRVWALLRTIPPGTTLTYGAVAAQLGQPNASRAVGTANGRNPIAIVIPCHRVIAANQTLGGYAGGLQRKRWLLTHEGVTLPMTTQLALWETAANVSP